MDFNRLAECAATVMVGGVEVAIRAPSTAARKASAKMVRVLKDGGEDLSLGERDVIYIDYLAQVMADMVVTEQPVSVENWSRVIQLRGEHEHADDLNRLIDAVQTLLYGPELKEKLTQTIDGTADHIEEAADAVGKSDSTSPGP